MSIDFEVAGENLKVAGKLICPPRLLGTLYGRGLKLHFFALFFSYIFFYIFLITCITIYSLLFEKAVQ
jgi:hypothetical protein